MWESDHAAQTAGAQIVESGPGHARVRLTVRKDMVNGHAIAHGGYLFMLADIAFGYACNGYGPAAVARSGHIEFLAPANEGDVLEAVATERARDGRNGIYDVTVRRPSDDTPHRGVPRPQPDAAHMTTKERLSLEAARMFSARGYHGTSIGDLAGALGIQKASVYSHISGKHDLLAEAALAGAVAFHAAQDAVPADTAPAERIRVALAAHLGVVSEQLDVAGRVAAGVALPRGRRRAGSSCASATATRSASARCSRTRPPTASCAATSTPGGPP